MHWLRKNSIELIKISLVIVAGVFAYIEYKDKDYRDRVSTALETLGKFYASEDYKALGRVEAFWLSDEITTARDQVNENKRDATSFRLLVLKGVSERPELQADFERAFRGLRSVAICGILNSCDRPTLCMHLSQPIQDLRCNFREYVAQQAFKASSCPIDEMSYFVDTYCAEWMKSYMGASRYDGIKDNECLYSKEHSIAMIGKPCITSILHKSEESIWARYIPF